MAARMSRGGEIAVAAAIGLAVFAALGIAIFFGVLYAERHHLLPAAATLPTAANGYGSPIYRQIQQDFPEDYRDLVNQLAAASAGSDSVEALSQQWMIRWRRDHYRAASRAPHAELAAFFRAQAALGDVLAAQSPAACAAFFRGPIGDQAEQTAVLTQAQEIEAVALVRAARTGIDRPAGRAALSPRDTAAITAAFRAVGADKDEVGGFMAGGFRPADDVAQCRYSQHITHAILRIPPDTGDRLMASLLVQLADARSG